MSQPVKIIVRNPNPGPQKVVVTNPAQLVRTIKVQCGQRSYVPFQVQLSPDEDALDWYLLNGTYVGSTYLTDLGRANISPV